MKKNFLFGLLAIWLASFWFGGISMATDITVSDSCESPENCYDNLGDAIAVEWNNRITLLSDVQIDGSIEIGKSLTLDLNWHSITISNDYQIIINGGDVNVTIEGNWSITKTAWWSALPMIFIKNWADVIIENWTFTAVNYVINIGIANGDSNAWGSLTINGGTFTNNGLSESYSALISRNNENTEITINWWTITSDKSTAIYLMWWSLEINNNTEVNAKVNCITQWANTNLTIKGWTFRSNGLWWIIYTKVDAWESGLTITGWEFYSTTSEDWHITYWIIAGNAGNVVVSGWEFHITNWACIIARWWNVTLEGGELQCTDDSVTQWIAGHGSMYEIEVPAGKELVMDLAFHLNNPNGGNPKPTTTPFTVTNEQWSVYLIKGVAGNQQEYGVSIMNGDDVVPVTLTNTTAGSSDVVISQPTAPEAPEWKAFGGWMKGNAAWDFTTVVSDTITLTPKWASTAWELWCWKDANWECNSDVGTYDVTIDGNKITFSNIDLNYPGAWAWRPTGDAGYYGVKIIAPAADTTHTSTIKIWSNSYDMNDTYKDGVEEDGRYFLYYWPHVTAEEVITALNNTNGIVTQTVTATINEIPTTLTIEINVNDLKYTATDGSTVALEVVKGVVREVNWVKQWQVTFDVDGYDAQTIANWEKATEPATKPTKSCNSFNGWYNWNTKYDFDTPVTSDISLTAKWSYTCSSSSWGGSSSYSCKNLPDNATANNSTKPTKSTDYSYSTDTTKVCTFQCKSGYTWNEKDAKCEKSDASDTTKTEENKTDENVSTNEWSNNDGSNGNGATASAEEFSQEFIDAYNFAHKNGITTKESIEDADMYGPLTRIAMAKMLSQYAINVLGQKPDTDKVVPNFPDVDAQLDADYNNGVTLAYQLWIMWIGIQEFRPFAEVTRAEFGTALSRMLFGTADGEWNEWYKTHLDKLMLEKIITNDDPNLKELRGYVMIMLMRSASDK